MFNLAQKQTNRPLNNTLSLKQTNRHITPCCLHMQVPAVTFPVTVRGCRRGEVQQENDTCMTCPATTYSYTPTASTCLSPCPANANCSGGATLVPTTGYWHSAPNSTYMVACPNANACQGDRDALLTCQGAAYMLPAISGEAQVIKVCLTLLSVHHVFDAWVRSGSLTIPVSEYTSFQVAGPPTLSKSVLHCVPDASCVNMGTCSR